MGIGGIKITIKTNIGVGIKQEAKLDFDLNFIAYTTCTLQPDKYLTKYLINISQNFPQNISSKYVLLGSKGFQVQKLYKRGRKRQRERGWKKWKEGKKAEKP